MSNFNEKLKDELQEKLYNNIALLNRIHPPSEDFTNVFKKEMFAKINKSAFLHVVHYLLTTLDPKVAAQKLVTWPTCNISLRENKFRSEVLQYIAEISKTYEDANLPTLMSSHLLAPGGYKFINFMYHLSQLVLRESLRRIYPDEILERPKLSKDEAFNSKICENFEKYSRIINEETKEAMSEFERTLELSKVESLKIIDEQKSVHVELKEIQDNIEAEECRFKNLQVISNEELNEKLQNIKTKSEVFKNIIDAYSECQTLMSYLRSFQCAEYSDLSELIKSLNVTLKRQLSELPTSTITELEYKHKLAMEKKEELELTIMKLQNKYEVLAASMNSSKEILRKNIDEIQKS